MEQADLIWMNGELVAWEDAKVHVLTHGLHYGTGVFEGIRAYDTARGPAIFRHHDHLDRLFKSAELYYMPIPYTLEELRAATHELIAANGLRSCYIRPIAFRGYGQMGLFPLDAPVDVAIAVVAVGRLPGRGGQAHRHPRQGLELAADQARLADPARQGVGPVPQQRAGQDRGAQGRLRGGDPARRPRLRVRGLGREHLRRARRPDRHAAADRRDPRRHQPQVGDPDRPRPRLRGRRARRRARRALPRRRGVPDRDGGRAGPGRARSTTTRSATASAGPDHAREHPARRSTTRCTAATARYAASGLDVGARRSRRTAARSTPT